MSFPVFLALGLLAFAQALQWRALRRMQREMDVEFTGVWIGLRRCRPWSARSSPEGTREATPSLLD